jgi:hypothetical protein
MTMSTVQIRDLLLPGLHDVFGDYPDHPDEWSEIFERNTSKLAFEREVEMRMMPLASLRAEGAATTYADMAEHAVYVYRHIQPAIGFVITRNAIRDNQYASLFNPGKASLKSSMRQTKETYGAAVLNLAQDTTGAYYGGDGAPLLSTAHPIYNGTVANTAVVQAQLSETALNDAYVTMGNFKQASGLKVPTKPRKLIVALQNGWVAERLLHTTGRVGTADNDVNVLMRSVGAIPEGYRVNHYLTNVQGWYVLTDCPNGLKYFQRDPLESDIFVDYDTDNLKVKATERYSFGWSNWRGIYGCMP